MTDKTEKESSKAVTHGECAGCGNTVQPIRWQHFHQEAVYPDGELKTFTGMKAICRRCGFMIARLGNAGEGRWRSRLPSKGKR